MAYVRHGLGCVRSKVCATTQTAVQDNKKEENAAREKSNG